MDKLQAYFIELEGYPGNKGGMLYIFNEKVVGFRKQNFNSLNFYIYFFVNYIHIEHLRL